MKKVGLALIAAVVLFVAICRVNAQISTAENMKTFFDHTILNTLKIQVNATTEAQPAENITVDLRIDGIIDVDLLHFNFSVYGFVQGEEKTLLANITGDNLKPYNAPIERSLTFNVPEQVWGKTIGELILTFKIEYGPFILDADELPCRFDMTIVKNVYLENLESNFQSLNQTYWELMKNYTELQKSQNELSNTRIAVGVLAITTVFFVATTAYLILRKPKQYW